MKKWKIVTDSGSCIRDIETDKIDFSVVPLILNVGNKVFIDDENLDVQDVIDTLASTNEKSTSACPSPSAYAEHFKGAENVICINITGGLSGSFNSAELGKNIAKEENENLNIEVYDSRSAGGEMDLLIRKAVEIIESDENQSVEEVIRQLKEYHQGTHVDFLLESVKNLVNNGRVNKLTGSMIGLLGIRLVGTRTPEGTIELAHKSKGLKRGIKTLIEDMVARGYNGGRVEISHGNNEEVANTFLNALLVDFPNAATKIRPMSALCTFYAEKNGLIIGFEF